MRELLKQALEALNIHCSFSTRDNPDAMDIGIAAIAALKAELAKPEQATIKQGWDVDTLLAKPKQDHGFDRTASHMAGEYVDTAEQEPVAWVNEHNTVIIRDTPPDDFIYSWKPLYTSPPRKEWVGLTDDEITNIGMTHQSLHQIARAIEAKLKELNG